MSNDLSKLYYLHAVVPTNPPVISTTVAIVPNTTVTPSIASIIVSPTTSAQFFSQIPTQSPFGVPSSTDAPPSNSTS